MVDAQPTRNKDLNATLTNFWEINKIPDECNDPEATDVQKHFQDTIEFNKVTGRYNVRLPWKDNKQNLPTNFTLTKKKTKQPATYPKRKTSRAYLQIQRPTARSTQERIYRTSPRSEHTSRCHTLHTPFSSLQGKQHNSYENRLRPFSKNIIYGIKPQRLPSYRAWPHTKTTKYVTHLQITQHSLHGRYRKGVPTNGAQHSRQGIRNRSQGTTFIAEEQKHIGRACGSR